MSVYWRTSLDWRGNKTKRDKTNCQISTDFGYVKIAMVIWKCKVLWPVWNIMTGIFCVQVPILKMLLRNVLSFVTPWPHPYCNELSWRYLPSIKWLIGWTVSQCLWRPLLPQFFSGCMEICTRWYTRSTPSVDVYDIFFSVYKVMCPWAYTWINS